MNLFIWIFASSEHEELGFVCWYTKKLCSKAIMFWCYITKPHKPYIEVGNRAYSDPYTLEVLMFIWLYLITFYNIGCSEYSMQLNASRIKVLQAQDDLVSAMREAASKDLLNVSHHKFHHHHNYEGLLKSLIVQVLVKHASYYVNFLIPYNNITPCFLKYGSSFVSASCFFSFPHLHFMLLFMS